DGTEPAGMLLAAFRLIVPIVAVGVDPSQPGDLPGAVFRVDPGALQAPQGPSPELMLGVPADFQLLPSSAIQIAAYPAEIAHDQLRGPLGGPFGPHQAGHLGVIGAVVIDGVVECLLALPTDKHVHVPVIVVVPNRQWTLRVRRARRDVKPPAPSVRAPRQTRAGESVAGAGSLQRLPAEQTKDGNETHLCQLETNLSRLNRRRVRVPQRGEHA